MATESPIEVDDDWFVNEDKTIRFTMAPAANVTGWTFLWELRRRREPGPPVLTKATGSGVVAVAPLTGIITVQVDAADTAAFGAASYHHTLWRNDPGNKTLLAFGGVVLRKASDA